MKVVIGKHLHKILYLQLLSKSILLNTFFNEVAENRRRGYPGRGNFYNQIKIIF